MGHDVVFIVGDVNAKIGTCCSRSDERPRSTERRHRPEPDHLIRRQQVTLFFDFAGAEFAAMVMAAGE